MNNQRTVILAIGLAVILVACSVGISAMTFNGGSNDANCRPVTDTSTYHT